MLCISSFIAFCFPILYFVLYLNGNFPAMRILILSLLIIQIVQIAYSANILIVNPAFGHSHTKFLGRIGDILAQNGHQVTELVPMLNPSDYKKVSKLTKVIQLPQDSRVREMNDVMHKGEGMFKTIWTMDPTPQAMSKMAQNMTNMFSFTCETTLDNQALWMQLKDEQFDIGLTEAFDFCGYGMFHMLGVKSFVTTSSSIMFDHIAYLIGQPIVPSYVPGTMGDASERMSFSERAWNAVGSYLGSKMFLGIMNRETELFREKVASDFPDLGDLIADNSALVFTNSVPYLDFPHPTLHKVHEIGGIGIPTVKPLNEEWSAILNKKSKNIYISFGSVAKSKMMPPELKRSVIETAKLFPGVQFIWKYEGDDLTNLPENLFLSKWTPQSDLLADPRLTLFITHGGLGSTTEIAYSGIPALFVPLFADQPRNAMMLKRQGVAESLTKHDFADPLKLAKKIELFLHDDSYKKNATRLAKLLHNVPFTAEELLVKNVEFLGRVGHLKQLDPYGRKLSFVKYFLLDVIGAILAAVLLIVLFIIFVFKKLFSMCRTKKVKKTKTN